jgi:signal transduction histidine kinase
MGDKNIFKVRPYARLLTMLGEQLIKNEKVALGELIKNSYDADADWVQVRLTGFLKDKEDDDKLIVTKSSMIEIEDDGHGMAFEVLRDAWMNPATPIKFNQKGDESTRRTTDKKRIIQGEKGIGRFATYKLGSSTEIITRSKTTPRQEIYLNADLSKYDDDLISENDQKKEIFIDELEFDYTKRDTPIDIIEKKIVVKGESISRKNHGTIIRLKNLKGEWSRKKLSEIVIDLAKLESPFRQSDSLGSFIIDIQIDGKSQTTQEDPKEELLSCFKKAPIHITHGRFDDKEKSVSFEVNGRHVKFGNEKLRDLKEYEKRFYPKIKERNLTRAITCGPFSFEFHVFDLSSAAPAKYILTKGDKDYVKSHRIYLYRDDIRVIPYGDPDDDWIKIDVLRGTGRAGDYLSMDQSIGYVHISQKDNPGLKDKTNREGLLEMKGEFEDFRAILQSILGIVHLEYKKYKVSLEPKDTIEIYKEKKVQSQLDRLKYALDNREYRDGLNILAEVSTNYSKERSYLTSRAEQTEELAAVGLAVETTSHDIMMMIARSKETLHLLVKAVESGNADEATVTSSLNDLHSQLSFIQDQLEGIQPMFRSTKRKSKVQSVKAVVEKVGTYFKSFFKSSNIELVIIENGPALDVLCNEGVLMQVFINLFDNSVHWLRTVDVERKIQILIDGEAKSVLVSDNGPGIDKDDVDYIFNPFFSTKGLQGRGLGLYITKQLLERYDYDITLEPSNKSSGLTGATFEIDLNSTK